jgi:hypothetical protein
MKKSQIEFSFTWLFAILAGIVVLVIVFYLISSIIRTSQTEQSAKVGTEIGVLTNPLESGFEEGTKTEIVFPVETRIYNKCELSGFFGVQGIAISQKSFNSWTSTNLEVEFGNKYFFSEIYVEGKKDTIFSKPFEFPYKIADLIFILPEDKQYCFLNAPEEIKSEIKDLFGEEKVKTENCSKSENYEKVCFESGKKNCNIFVDRENQYVQKNKTTLYYETDALMYGAIFSDKDIYECQVKRLMKKVAILAGVYHDKISIIAKQGCANDLGADLIGLANNAESLEDSSDLSQVKNNLENIKSKNENNYECRLW